MPVIRTTSDPFTAELVVWCIGAGVLSIILMYIGKHRANSLLYSKVFMLAFMATFLLTIYSFKYLVLFIAIGYSLFIADITRFIKKIFGIRNVDNEIIDIFTALALGMLIIAGMRYYSPYGLQMHRSLCNFAAEAHAAFCRT